MSEDTQLIDYMRERLAEKGKKRLAVAKNAAAWALFGNDDDEMVTISTKDSAAAELVAIRVLAHLNEHGLIDNEPLLGLASTRDILLELEARCDIGAIVFDPSVQENALKNHVQAALESMSLEELDYVTKEIKPVTENIIDINGEPAKEEETNQ